MLGIFSVCFSKTGRLMFAGYEEHMCYAWETISSEGCAFACVCECVRVRVRVRGGACMYVRVCGVISAHACDGMGFHCPASA